MNDIYKQAAQMALRFDAANKKGLSVEQLFQLPLQSSVTQRDDLDGVSRILLAEIKTLDSGSMVTSPSGPAAQLELKRAILQDIIDTRKAEAKAKVDDAARRSEIAQLKEIRETKRNAELADLPVEEINRRLAALGSE